MQKQTRPWIELALGPVGPVLRAKEETHLGYVKQARPPTIVDFVCFPCKPVLTQEPSSLRRARRGKCVSSGQGAGVSAVLTC